MTVFADTCARALLDMEISREQINDCRRLLTNPDLKSALNNPTVGRREKLAVIDRLFPQETKSFWKVICSDGLFYLADEILDAYDSTALKKQGCAAAELIYVTEPSEEQKNEIRKLVCRIKGTKDAKLSCRRDTSLIGGYCLQIDDTKYDRSIIGGFKNLQKILLRR